MIRIPQNFRIENPGHSDAYYSILSNLEKLSKEILGRSEITASDLRLIKTDNDDVDLLIKTAEGKEFLARISADERLANEIFVYRNMWDNGIRAPKVLAYDISKRALPYIYEIIENLSGNPPTELSSKTFYSAGVAVGTILRNLHNIEVVGFGAVGQGFDFQDESWLAALERYTRSSLDEEAAEEAFGRVIIDRVYENTIYNKTLNLNQSRLIHGAISDKNVLILRKPNGYVLINPGMLVGGDPMFDLASSSIPLSRKQFSNGVATGYRQLTENEIYRLRRMRLLLLFLAATRLFKENDKRFRTFKTIVHEELKAIRKDHK